MKKIITICLLLSTFSTLLVGQMDSTEKRFRHEIGIDASSILGGVLIPSPFGFTTEQYAYPLSYRLYTPWVNLRTGIGLNVANEMYASVFEPFGLDTLEGKNLVVNSRIGLERMKSIGKYWQFYYGIDYEYTHYKDVREYNYYWQGYLVKWVIENSRHGISPLLGFRLALNDRIGLQSELKIALSKNRQDMNQYYSSTTIDPNLLPDNFHDLTKKSTINFLTPTFLILTVKL